MGASASTGKRSAFFTLLMTVVSVHGDDAMLLNKSPIDTWPKPCSSDNLLHRVPFPDPGAPTKVRFITVMEDSHQSRRLWTTYRCS
jgi:hypothetical protein